jgi:recombination protein RecT
MSAQEKVDRVAQKTPSKTLALQLENPKLLDFIRSVAPGLDPLGVVRVAYAHVQNTPALQRCSVASIVRGVAEAAKLSLTVDGILGHAYLVPYGNEAKMLIGYRGFIHLAYQSGAVTRFHADTIHEHDEYEYREGVQPWFEHKRPLDGRGQMIGAYAIAHLASGAPPLVAVMGVEEIEARRARSASFKRKPEASPWTTDFAAMARKCPIRELGKVIPYPTLQGAALRDDAIDEGRAVPDDAGVIDLGDAVEAGGGACPTCGSLHLDAQGRCHDCNPEGAA